MIVSFRYVLGWMVSAFRCREDLVLENLALRRRLLALHAKRPRRRLTALHKLFWVALRTFWSGWTKPLVLVTPRTVVSWHRAGFRLYWTWVSRARQVGGRKRTYQQRGSRPDLPYDCRESDLGSTAHSRRTYSSWVLTSRKGASRDGFGELREIQILRSDGSRSSGIIGKPLPLWTSSPSQRSPLVFCIVFSLSPRPTKDPALQRDEKSQCFLGYASNCETRGPINSRTDSSYSTETQSSEPMWFRR